MTILRRNFLVAEGLVKGTMTLIDQARGETLYGRMGPGTESSGGSAANTIAGFASLGGTAGFIGKVRADQLGEVFRHDIESLGVAHYTPAATEGPSTARCLVLVSPDAQRTMATYLGISTELGPIDLDQAAIARAKVVYLEGYLWDPPRAKQAFLQASRLAHDSGGQVALTLSDIFCVERHRQEFRELLGSHVDILFANELELMALTQAKDFAGALAAIRGKCKIAAVTRSEKGSVILSGDKTTEIKPEKVGQLVDSTGAGDLYASGFLYGLTRGLDMAACGRLGSLAAAEVISHIGARPQVSLKELAAQRYPKLMKG
ncbi:MAG: adenosine kinase [Proteobacteria bacterium]|nr:adenosine kinase [Pseudomonadota bacterium]